MTKARELMDIIEGEVKWGDYEVKTGDMVVVSKDSMNPSNRKIYKKDKFFKAYNLSKPDDSKEYKELYKKAE